MTTPQPAKPVASPAQTLPTELLHQIYYLLGPRRFHAARHTCRHWMATSLHLPLLELQIKRGGWLEAVPEKSSPYCLDDRVSSLSKYLARETWLMG